MTDRTDSPEPAEDTQDSPTGGSPEDAGQPTNAEQPGDAATPHEPAASESELPDSKLSDSDPSDSDFSDSDLSDSAAIAAPADLGENAHQVVTALLGHQQDLIAELRGVYERLEQVREVDYARLENRVADAEYVVSGGDDVAARLERLTERVDDLTAAANDQSAHASRLTQQLSEAKEQFTAQLAERDARIAAQNARIAELESAISAAGDSAEAAHQKLQVLAEETESSLIHRVSERVSPAAAQAKNALNNIARRLRR